MLKFTKTNKNNKINCEKEARQIKTEGLLLLSESELGAVVGGRPDGAAAGPAPAGPAQAS